jgi:hypothetical protein
MADEQSPITPENLKEVLDRLNEVLEEAARLRKDVVRQLSDQRKNSRQHLTARKQKKPAPKR